jgi:hypothetical protein
MVSLISLGPKLPKEVVHKNLTVRNNFASFWEMGRTAQQQL